MNDIVEKLRNITLEMNMIKQRFEDECNFKGNSLEEKRLILNNYSVAYFSLLKTRDKLLRDHMNSKRG